LDLPSHISLWAVTFQQFEDIFSRFFYRQVYSLYDHQLFTYSIFAADLIHLLPCDAIYAVVMCLSVRLSQASNVPKLLKVVSCKQFHIIAQGLFKFSESKDLGEIPMASLNGAPNRGGLGYIQRFLTNIFVTNLPHDRLITVVLRGNKLTKLFSSKDVYYLHCIK